jgi:cyclic pyranopterin phosphate synthase
MNSLNPTAKPELRDRFGRRLTYLRLSVTDRCNLHCAYCRPLSSARASPVAAEDRFDEIGPLNAGAHSRRRPECDRRRRSGLLTFEECVRLVEMLAALGIEKVRLTGGEPLLRRDLPHLCRLLKAVPGVRTLALTTNGVLLGGTCKALRTAGVSHLNISLDTLDRARFQRLTGQDLLLDVLAGIRAASAAGFASVKLNCVLQRGFNDASLPALVSFAAERGLNIRFIEVMPTVEAPDSSGILMVAEALALLRRRFDIRPLAADPPDPCGGPATTYRLLGSETTISFIGAISVPFCRRCNRLRVLADGRLKTCLYAPAALNLRPLLRSQAPAAAMTELIRRAVRLKPAAHPFTGERESTSPKASVTAPKAEPDLESMVTIGG